MLEIRIVVNKGGMIESVYTSSKQDVDVEIIDFCTDDPYEIDLADREWNKLQNEKWKRVY